MLDNLTDPPTSDPPAAMELRIAALEHQGADILALLQLAEERHLALEARLAAEVFCEKTTAKLLARIEDAGGCPATPARHPRHLSLVGGA